ncbi:SDR family oxidoreductase [Nisaea sp.]|uniref:SDR family oxidoreductase n=1 Tax=Nisaea sp. TaxID=2024842 RepID=UPI003264D637
MPFPSNLAPGHLFCFGAGYTCHRLAQRLLNQGWRVSGTTRSDDGADILRQDGIEASLFGGVSGDTLDKRAFADVTHVIGSIPPGPEGDPALAAELDWVSHAPSLRWVGYLSTPAVYGDRGGALVHEDDDPNPGSTRGKRRLAAERAWVDNKGAPVQVFRLSGIYGPGRSAIDQLRSGKARIIDKPGQVFNRIHVDDIGTILLASMQRPNHGQIYNVADDEACPSGDVIRYAAALLGMEPPEPIPFDSAELSPMARSFYSECKRLDTGRIKSELGVKLAYPTYREGLQSILQSEL